MSGKINEGIIQGFYYDQQITNPLLMVGLYPNQEWTGEDWSDVSDPDDEEYPTFVDSEGKTSPIIKYSKTPICTSVITEDFQISIANNYSDFGGDPIGELWNSNKPMAPYLSEMAKGLGIMSEKTATWIKNNDLKEDSLLRKGLNGLANVLGNMSSTNENMANYLSRSLVVQGTRFSYYSGTGIDFGNLQMKFTLFSQYIKEKDSYIFKSVDDQLQKILPYIIGEFKPVTEGGDGEIGKFIQEFASWQMPPGNFSADLKNVDIVQKGTLKLKIGSYFAIENMVITGCQLQYSKAMIKDPESSSANFLPMSCDVTLSLKPVTRFSRKSLERFIFGKSTEISRKEVLTKVDAAYNTTKLKLDTALKYSGDNIASEGFESLM